MTKERRLGRGLAALLSSPSVEFERVDAGAAGGAHGIDPAHPGVPSPHFAASERVGQAATDGLMRLPLDQIDANPYQPRRDFSESEIAALAESLREHQLLQPILVRQVGERWQLISGERRFRAAQLAGWQSIPAQIRDVDDRLAAELAIVENLQRKDLNAVEKALSFQRYLREHGCTQDELARRLKIDRSTIANLMRLLELPDVVLDSVRSGTLSAGHARAILPLGDDYRQIQFAERIHKEELSVREVERLVQELITLEDDTPTLAIAGSTQGAAAGTKTAPARRTRSQQVASLEQNLKRALGSKVEIKPTAKGRGKIVIHFGSHEEFDRLCETLGAK